jgi:outer membrane protein assembly factor BamB
MTKLQLHAIIVYATLTLGTVVTAAKIAPPKPVVPVEANGVRYSADRDGSDQYAVAIDIATGKQLWKVKVFHTHIKFWIEEDVQWVFITDLKLMDSSLFVRDGKARCYAVDINSHRVRKAPCSVAFGQQERASQ